MKGFIKYLVPLSENIMTSYYAGPLVQTAKETNMTKGELLKLVEETFDGTIHIHLLSLELFLHVMLISIYLFIYSISY